MDVICGVGEEPKSEEQDDWIIDQTEDAGDQQHSPHAGTDDQPVRPEVIVEPCKNVSHDPFAEKLRSRY